MAKGNRKKTPSRIKYEQNHPTVSFRPSKELYDRLQVVKQAEGKSYTDIMEAGVGVFEVKVKKEEEIRQQIYDEVWEEGVNAAWDLLAVTYPCSKCGKQMTVDTEEEKKAIRKFIIASGWHHGDCNNP